MQNINCKSNYRTIKILQFIEIYEDIADPEITFTSALLAHKFQFEIYFYFYWWDLAERRVPKGTSFAFAISGDLDKYLSVFQIFSC